MGERFSKTKYERNSARRHFFLPVCVGIFQQLGERKKEKGKNIALMGGWNSFQNWSDMKTVRVIIINF